MNYFTTRIAFVRSNDPSAYIYSGYEKTATAFFLRASNVLTKPLQLITNGKIYEVYRTGTQGKFVEREEKFDLVEKEFSFLTTTKKVIGWTMGLVFFPVVIVGIGLKAIIKPFIKKDLDLVYSFVKGETTFTVQKPKIVLNKIMTPLKPFMIHPQELSKVQQMNWLDCTSRIKQIAENFQVDARKLDDFFAEIFNRKKFELIQPEMLGKANKDLHEKMKLLLLELEKQGISDAGKKKVLENLSELGKKDALFWLETLDTEYLNLKKEDDLEQKILRFIVREKEEIIRNYAFPFISLSFLNIARLYAKKLGLPEQSAKYDGAASVLKGVPFKKMFEAGMYITVFEKLKPQNLVQAVQDKMKEEFIRNPNFYDEIGQFLKEKYSLEDTSHYFEKIDGEERITKKATQDLLVALGFLKVDSFKPISEQ